MVTAADRSWERMTMSQRTRITAVGLLLAALTSGIAQALPLIPQSHLTPRTEARDLLILAMDWLASVFHAPGAPAVPGPADRGPFTGQEKEGNVLDPNGRH